MAIAELTQEAYEAMEEAAEAAAKVRLAVHDASRLEWSLSVPLPSRETPTKYSLRVEMQVPQNAFVRHLPWDQMQAFTRLDGPAITAVGDVMTIDALRRGALAMAHQLARASDGFQRHCRLAASLFATAAHTELEDALTIWIEAALRIAQEARERLSQGRTEDEPLELGRERNLVDEYVSVRLFEMLASAERSLSNAMQSKSAHAALLAPVVGAVEARLAGAMVAEIAYREEHGFPNVDPKSPAALELYLDRASRLKKHFQEVLFLEQETFQIAERAYHWIAAFVALLASTWAFAWQLALVNRASAASKVGSGLAVFALVAGVVYASKDRLKEIGRNWMTRRVHRVWGAQRITRYRAPRRRLPNRDIIVHARESFNQTTATLPDPLNPECGASVPMTVLTYEHRGEVLPNAALMESGVMRVKHVFRYDLSPLFGRLDDATKPVPVLDDARGRVRFIDAPRCYRIPITVHIESGTQKQTERATLVMHKRGLERVEREKDSSSSLGEVGLEPG